MSAIDLAVCEIKKRQTKTAKYMEQMEEEIAERAHNQQLNTLILTKVLTEVLIDISK